MRAVVDDDVATVAAKEGSNFHLIPFFRSLFLVPLLRSIFFSLASLIAVDFPFQLFAPYDFSHFTQWTALFRSTACSLLNNKRQVNK